MIELTGETVTLTQDTLLLALGLVARRQSGGTYDLFRNRAMFPIQSLSGRVIGFGGRILPDAGDSDGFHEALEALAEAVRSKGAPLADDEFVGSDAILPGPDTSLAEARDMLGEEGLIPG